MTAISIITTTLQAIPPRLRQGLLTGWAAGVVVLGVLDIAAIHTAWVPEAWLYIGGYLGVQSAANITPGDGKRIKRT